MVAHWVETGPWWQSRERGAGRWATATPPERRGCGRGDLLAEREVWRVEAARGGSPTPAPGRGVFDLVFDWAEGSWQLARCLD